jgi:glycosyltransferase involved in cell wall biosynthesis
MAEALSRPERVPVTVVIPTLNESSRIATCLASVAWAGEIIVADGGSEDDTVERARQAGARVVELPGGWIADQRNAAIAEARHDWILALDADEVASAELATEIGRRLVHADAEAFDIRRRNFYRGVELTSGSWSRDWITRLYRRNRRYLRHRVHEHLDPGPPAARLAATILHHPYQDLAHHVRKIHRYAEWAAADLADRGIQPSIAATALRPLWRFWRSYLLDGGWRQGRAGFIAAALGAYGVFLKYAFLEERAAGPPPPPGDGR